MNRDANMGTQEVAAAKASARKSAFARRAAAHALHRTTASAALADHLGDRSGMVIAGYLPIRSEADPVPAMTALSAQNRICVPVVVGADQPLRFREWTAEGAVVVGPFGVAVPAAGEWLVPDLVIVPLLAWDGSMHRLGYGGGFYDRTLAALRSAGTVETVGFAYADQRVAHLPCAPTDMALDRIVTEEGVIRR